jgi:hypothetical protein
MYRKHEGTVHLVMVGAPQMMMLHSGSDNVRGFGAAVKYLSHRASRIVGSAWLIPPHSGAAHLTPIEAIPRIASTTEIRVAYFMMFSEGEISIFF